jgi:glutathione peroxidase
MRPLIRILVISLLLAWSLPATPLHKIPVVTLAGEMTDLRPFEGKVMLVVNVASKCGLTPQYDQLEALYQTYRDKGLVVLGFPCNQFANQEPGSSEEIAEFCRLNHGVSFPLFEKIEVNGDGRHPLYQALAGPASPFPGDVAWNFTKFLVGPDGTVLARFEPRVKPDAPEVVAAVEGALRLGKSEEPHL